MKGKPLLPTLRQKKRYVVYEYISEREISNEEVFKEIILSFKELYGKIILAKAGIKHIAFNEKKSILKINNKYVNELRVAMSQISEINNIKINLYTIGISGIIKKAKTKYMQ